MRDDYLKKIEYHKILQMLNGFVDSDSAKQEVLNLKPMTDFNQVQQGLDELRTTMNLCRTYSKPSFTGLYNLDSIAKRLKAKGVLNNVELLRVKDNCYLSKKAYEYFTQIDKNIDNLNPAIVDKFQSIVPLYDLEREISKCILNDEDIADDASKELLRIRKAIFRSKESVKDKLQSFIKSERNKKYLQDTIITMRQDRFVVPVKNEYRNEVKGIVHDISQTGSTLFIEPMEIVNINNKIRELLVEENREIERILKELSYMCASDLDELIHNYEACLYLDLVFGKAQFGLSYRGSVASINNRQYIDIKNARHPLIPDKQVVPIDFSIGDNYKILVITGPNTGGKTVSLKTVGLLTAMNQSAMAISADEGSHMGLFDEIYVDIGDEQSIEQNLSTFSSHMTNIIGILKKADSKGLVLLDELGAGTDPVEGSALALAIIETLKERDITSVVTTHYTELKTYASTREGIENASCEFDVVTLKPTYRLLIGIPGKSNALYISKRLGLSNDIIEKAKESIDDKNTDYEKIILSLEKNRQKMEKERIKAENRTKEINDLKKELIKEKEDLKKKQDEILDKARLEADKIKEKALKRAEDLVNEIDLLKKNKININAKTEAEFKTLLRDLKEEALESKDRKFKEGFESDESYESGPFDLKIGDRVMIRSMKKEADVLSEPDKNQQVNVQIGIIKMSVALDDLYPINQQKDINKRLTANIASVKRTPLASMELDIRGDMVFEAESKIFSFIEQGYLSGIHELSIIHGKGTGLLRQGVHEILKENPYVKSFRLGKYGEGESGVTIITLKKAK